MQDQIPTISEIERELCERSYEFFLEWYFVKILKKKFLKNPHITMLCGVMEQIYAGEIKNVVITIPPRHGKTLIVVIGFIAWCFAKSKDANFLHVSYSDSLALKNSDSIKDIVFSDKFTQYWRLSPKKSEQSKKMWSIRYGGGVYATSSGGAVTGFGAGTKGAEGFSGALIIDDPQKPNAERFELARKTIIENFENVLSSRRNNNDTPIVLIQQRLHEEDLAGYLMSGRSSVGEFKTIKIQSIKEKEDGKNAWDKRKIGEELWEKEITRKQLNVIKKNNPTLFATQFQQEPSAPEGNMIKRKDLKFYKHLPNDLQYFFVSCDLNFKSSGTSNACYSAYGIKMPNVYLIKQRVGKWNFPDAVKNLQEFTKSMQKLNGIIIEKKANGEAMISTLQQNGLFGVFGMPADTSKIFRLSEVSMAYSSGNVWYPAETIAPWVVTHVHEIVTFPYAKYDDRVDAETQMLKYTKDKLKNNKFLDI